MKLQGKVAHVTSGNSGIGFATPRLGHLCEAGELANAVLFLASDDAAHIHAAGIVVDGGHTGAPAGAPIYRVSVAPLTTVNPS